MDFVLDQNFPMQTVGLPWPPNVRLTRLVEIDPELTHDHDDWEVFRALGQRGSIDGFITNDANILNAAREMVVLSQTRLVLIVTDGVGHDALRATGLIMTYLSQIVAQLNALTTRRPLIYTLKPTNTVADAIDKQIAKLAQRERLTWKELVNRELGLIDTP